MQTFMPSIEPSATAHMLDNKRLNKQILECYQILNVLSGRSMGWRNHPAVKMWRGSERVLWGYAQEMIYEARSRGIQTGKNEFNIRELYNLFWEDWGSERPEFMNDGLVMARVITTHRANLFLKDPLYYADFQYAVNSEYNSPCCDRCKYYWPTHDNIHINS